MQFNDSELDTISRALVVYKLFIHNNRKFINKRVRIEDSRNIVCLAEKLEEYDE